MTTFLDGFCGVMLLKCAFFFSWISLAKESTLLLYSAWMISTFSPLLKTLFEENLCFTESHPTNGYTDL